MTAEPQSVSPVVPAPHADRRSSRAAAMVACMAALPLGLASAASAQFSLTSGNGFAETSSTISAMGFDSDYDLVTLTFPAPSGGWASAVASVLGTTVRSDVLLTQAVSPRMVSARLIHKRTLTLGRVDFGIDSWGKDTTTLNLALSQPNTNVLIIARGNAVHAGSLPLPGSSGFINGLLSLKQTGQPALINWSYNLSSPGSAGNVLVAQQVMPVGSYQLKINSQSGGDPLNAELDLSVDLIAGCSTQEVSYALPPEGVPIDVTLDVGGNQLTKSIAVTGSFTGTVVLDCSNHPMALHLETIHLTPIDNPVVWDLPLGVTLYAWNISMDADGSLGYLGAPAPIANNCCGTLLGVSPVVSGSVDLVAADGATLSMTVNDYFEPSFAGVPFTLTGFNDGTTLGLQLGYTGVIDLGLGKGNPTVTSVGTVVGSGVACPRGDLNCDLLVGAPDLAILLGNWSSTPTSPGCGGTVPCAADLNFDGVVGPADLAILLGEWTVR